MGGDFNCPLNPAIDKKRGILNERKSVISCIRDCLQNELDLVHIWRIKHPSIHSFTWSQKSPRVFLLSRLLVNFEYVNLVYTKTVDSVKRAR